MKCVNHPEADAVAVCVRCGKEICAECKVESGGEAYCKGCISEKAGAQTKGMKSPGLAAFLSFIMAGMGQIYNGQPGKGLLIFFTSWLIIPWIYGIIDAYKIAGKINSGEISIPPRPGCVIAAVIFIIIIPIFVAIVGLLVAIAIPNFIAARDKAQARYNAKLIDEEAEYSIDDNGVVTLQDKYVITEE